MNSINLICRLGRDPELKYTQGGTAICNLWVAYEQGKNKEAGWMAVVALEKTAEAVAQYCHKGDEIGVSGRLSYRTWDQGNEKRNATEIVANRIDFLRKKGEGPGGGDRREERPPGDDADPFGDE